MWIVLVSIFGVLAIGMGTAIMFTAPGRNELKNILIADVDIKRLGDGTYTGEYHGTKDSSRDATVLVTISSGKVTNIKVTGGALAGDKQSSPLRNGLSLNDLFKEIITTQSLHVDAISGATLTCNAHLKAVENALEQTETK